jgi:hypothetical protein
MFLVGLRSHCAGIGVVNMFGDEPATLAATDVNFAGVLARFTAGLFGLPAHYVRSP